MAGCRILVVDDDVRVRTLLERILRADGHEVGVAATAEEGLEALQREIPDLLCVDLVLPGMSGLALAERVREDLYDMAPPIVLVSGSVEDLTERELERFDAVLGKPFKLEVLRRVVERHAKPAQRRKASQARFTAVGQSDDEAETG